jgi:hypothetical protein
MVETEVFVERIATAPRTDVVGPAQADGTEKRDHLPLAHGMHPLAGPMPVAGQQVWQLVVEELFDEGGGVLLHGGPQQGLEPGRIERLFGADLFPDDVQELRDFPALGRLDRPGFFLLSASPRIADCSIEANSSSKSSCT